MNGNFGTTEEKQNPRCITLFIMVFVINNIWSTFSLLTKTSRAQFMTATVQIRT